MTLPPQMRAEIAALDLRRGEPVLAVDADEVLVIFAEHLARFLEGLGFRLSLTEYRLDGAITEIATGRQAGKEEGWALISRFFETETHRQDAVAGAAEGLAALSRQARVIVLTNVPRFARAARIANLTGHGMPYPVVANEGGKGRVLAEIAARARAPVAFIDDSPVQIESAARHARDVLRLHFVGSPLVRSVVPKVPEAAHAPADWPEIVRTLTPYFG